MKQGELLTRRQVHEILGIEIFYLSMSVRFDVNVSIQILCLFVGFFVAAGYY